MPPLCLTHLRRAVDTILFQLLCCGYMHALQDIAHAARKSRSREISSWSPTSLSPSRSLSLSLSLSRARAPARDNQPKPVLAADNPHQLALGVVERRDLHTHPVIHADITLECGRSGRMGPVGRRSDHEIILQVNVGAEVRTCTRFRNWVPSCGSSSAPTHCEMLIATRRRSAPCTIYSHCTA